uniref:Uncharacterized protein n=1 Tax=Aegilops tauschii subsp. strangulata TaxID=200361 RepID=A0A453GJ11_AEGTS
PWKTSPLPCCSASPERERESQVATAPSSNPPTKGEDGDEVPVAFKSPSPSSSPLFTPTPPSLPAPASKPPNPP